MTKFDLHIHSCYSNNIYSNRLLCPPSSSEPEEIIEVAIERGMGAIAVTDHDNIIGSLRTVEVASKKFKDRIIVVPGVEVSSRDGHILAYNVFDNIPKNLTAIETIKIIKQKGGVAVAAHPFNVKYSIKKHLIDKYRAEFFALEMGNSRSLKNEFTKSYIEKHQLSFTFGSDAHSLRDIGLCYGKTWENVNTVDALLESIRSGRVSPGRIYDKKLVKRVVPSALKTFFIWKWRQLKSFVDKDVFLPYEDTDFSWN